MTERRLRNLFNKLKWFVDKKSLHMLYCAFFDNLATYGICAWRCAYESSIKPLLNLQKIILKIIDRSSNTRRSHLPLSLQNNYLHATLIRHYYHLRDKFVILEIKTRSKGIVTQKVKLGLGKIAVCTLLANYFKVYRTIWREWATQYRKS